jgi:hypothetical protein
MISKMTPLLYKFHLSGSGWIHLLSPEFFYPFPIFGCFFAPWIEKYFSRAVKFVDCFSGV